MSNSDLSKKVEKIGGRERAGRTKGLAAKVETSRIGGKKKAYSLDLRIHSPSALGYSNLEGIDTAPALVRLAKVKGLDAIGLVDFYDGAFVDRVVSAAVGTELVVVPGVEVRCKVGACDDVTLSCMFPEDYNSASIQIFLRSLGVPASAANNPTYILPHSLDRIIRAVEAEGGVILPSRIDKTPQRLNSLPILIEEYGFRAFDVVYPETAEYIKKRWPQRKIELLYSSSASALAQVGSRYSKMRLSNLSFAGIRDAVSRSI
jgi:hypothetical protein